jgi:TonB family protein
MAGDAARVAHVREGANRSLGVAVLASILLHALLLALPVTRELSALTPPEPKPLVARVERPESPPAPPQLPVREIRKPEPQRPGPVAKPAPAAPQPAPVAPVPPAALAAPAAPALAPAPAPAPAPVPRIDPSVVATVAPPASAVEVGALERYRQAVTRAAARFKRYPRVAIDNNWEGEVVVLVAIGADGRLASLRVKLSSGYEVLDQQALQMFDNASRFVPLPAELRGRACELELRAIYNLRDQRSG